MKTHCPKCETTYSVDQSKIPAKGTYVRCPKCNERFHLALPGEANRYSHAQSQDSGRPEQIQLAQKQAITSNISQGENVKSGIGQLKAKEEFKKPVLPNAPIVWVGFIFAAGFFGGEILEIIYGGDRRLGLVTTFIGFIGLMYWLYCVQTFHQILLALTIGQYVISPGKAVGYHFIPLYNFYWICKWPIELSKFINAHGKVTMVNGGVIAILLLLSLLAYRSIDGSIGLAIVFLVGLYLNSRIRKVVSSWTSEEARQQA